MNNMNNKNEMTIGVKIALAFGVMGIIIAGLGGLSYYGFSSSERAMKEAGMVRLPSVYSLDQMEISAEQMRGNMRTLAISGLPFEVRDRQYQNMNRALQSYQAARDIFEPLPQTQEEATLWQQFVPAWERYQREVDRYIVLAREFDRVGITDPVDLSRNIQMFTADHYALAHQVQRSINHGEILFEGGLDHTTCGAGRWLPHYETHNRELAAVIQGFEEPHRRFHQAIRAIGNHLQSGSTTEAQARYQDTMIPAMDEVFSIFHQLAGIADNATQILDDAEEQLFGSVMASEETAMDLLERLVYLNVEIADEVATTAISAATAMLRMSTIGFVLGVLLAIGLGFYISRNVKQLYRSLSEIIDGLNSGAVQVNESSTQLSSASQELSESTSEQAASLEESTSSLEEMSSQIKQTAENSFQAEQAMNVTAPIVDSGVKAMERMSATMQQIKNAAEETSAIINTINEIAFQTNLLALNAAVEAARAGEAGKGFAVVAEEVRNLAKRSADAAKNTASLIKRSQDSTEDGAMAATEVSENLQKVKSSVEKVKTLIAEISAAGKEQATGISQLTSVMAEMDKVVQQNAAASEESASSAEELSSQAEELKRMVDKMVAIVGSRGEGNISSVQKTMGSVSKQINGKTSGYAGHSNGSKLIYLGNQDGHEKKSGNARKENLKISIPLEDDDINVF